MKHNVHLNYLHYVLRWIIIYMYMMNNLVFREIHLNPDDNQMENNHWFFDFEMNCNHIQNVVNVNTVPVEVFQIWHLFLLPRCRSKSYKGWIFQILLTCKPWIFPASYRFSPVNISLLQKSRKLSITNEIKLNRFYLFD
jgi:hypothetical protein